MFTFDHVDMENTGLFCSTLHKYNCFTLRFMGVISTFCAPFRSLSEPTFSTLNNFSGNFASEILQTDFWSLLLNQTLYIGFCHRFATIYAIHSERDKKSGQCPLPHPKYTARIVSLSYTADAFMQFPIKQKRRLFCRLFCFSNL